MEEVVEASRSRRPPRLETEAVAEVVEAVEVEDAAESVAESQEAQPDEEPAAEHGESDDGDALTAESAQQD